MSLPVRLIFIIACIFITVNCVESTEHDYFREDFSSKWFSVFVWGMPAFSLYNFRADPAMVSNSGGINYLRLGSSLKGTASSLLRRDYPDPGMRSWIILEALRLSRNSSCKRVVP